MGQWTFFSAEKGQKWKKPLKISKNGFYKQILDFHCLPLCHTSDFGNFVKTTGPYYTAFLYTQVLLVLTQAIIKAAFLLGR
jgi:hypothetical protein